LPPPKSDPPIEDEEDELLADYPWVEGPVYIDHGTNVKLGKNVYLNFNTTFIDSCLITIGDRTLVGM
jgi:acetyltransferase-like isoleucine patch superfamily enzyme